MLMMMVCLFVMFVLFLMVVMSGLVFIVTRARSRVVVLLLCVNIIV